MNNEITSIEYKEFVKKKKDTTFERYCKWISKFLNVTPSNRKEIEDSIRQAELNLTPEQLVSAAFMSMIVLLVSSMVLTLLTGQPIIFVFLTFLTYYSYSYVMNYPKNIIQKRQIKASSDLVLAVLYIVIYMRHTPNLEGAVKFAASNLKGPLSKDLKKILWDIESKKYKSVTEALDNYVKKWKAISPPFVDAIYLIETSLVQVSEESRIQMLDEALDRILDGTYEQMVRYANSLRTPVKALYTLGISLPIFTLIMLPIIGAFLSDLISPTMIFAFYDLLLPFFIFFLMKKIMQKRPVGFSVPEIENLPGLPKKGKFYFGDSEISAIWPSLIFAIVFILPFIPYLLSPHEYPSQTDVYVSMLPIIGIGYSIVIYSYLTTFQRVKIRREIKDIEDEFSNAIFQLGNRIHEGKPVEIAIQKVAETMKGTKVANLFNSLVHNMQQLGLSLKKSIFDRRYGVLAIYPSYMVKSVFKIMLEGAQKSLEVAAISLINLGRYLKNVHRINEKIEDMLSETISDLQFQASFIAPLITGIVIGITAMIMIVLGMLQLKMETLQSSYTSTHGSGVGMASGFGIESQAWVFGFLNIKQSTPLYIFQPIVGIYVIEVILLMAYMLNEIKSAGDPIYRNQTIYKLLGVGLMMYIIVSVATTLMFGGVGELAIQIGNTL